MARVRKGSTLGSYRIEEQIGRGGMGVVYRATHLGLDRQVALKLIAEDLSEDEGFRERFRREPRIAAAIEHPNVIPVFDAGEVDGQLYVAMRLVEGDDLGTIIKRGPLAPERAARIVAAVGEALDAAHGHELVHRDVKPGNVLIETRDGIERVYLTDFGITKGGGSVGLTRTGDWVGTADYVAPEQIEGKDIDRRTDVYALGAVLYHSLTGEAPYARESEVAKIYAHLSKPPPSVSEKLRGVSPELDATIRRAMAKSPKDRYPTAGDFGREAVGAATGEGKLSKVTEKLISEPAIEEPEPTSQTKVSAKAAEPAPPPPPKPKRKPKPPRRRRAKAPATKAPPPADGTKVSEPADGTKVAEPTDGTKVAEPARGAAPPSRPDDAGTPAGPARGRTPVIALAAAGVIALGVVGYLVGSAGGDDDESPASEPSSGSSSASSAAPAADPGYASSVSASFKRLNATVNAKVSDLRKADTNDAQAGQLDDLAGAYSTAAVALRKLKPEADVVPVNKAIVAALGDERDAYRQMASAARAGDEGEYADGRSAVRRAQARLGGAVRRLNAVGYQVG